MRSTATCFRNCFFVILLSFSLCHANTLVAPVTSEKQANKSNPLCPKPLIVGWTGYPPFQINRHKNSPAGLEIELLHAIGNKIGCEFTYRETSAARQQWDLKQDIVDLVFSPQKTDKTAEYAYFSNPYRNMNIHLVVRKGEEAKYNLTSLEDLQNSSSVIGVKQGIYYGPEFEKLSTQEWFKSHIEYNVTSTMNIKKLAYGRLDVLFLEPVVQQELAKKLDVGSLISVHPFVLYNGPVYILFNKKSISPALIEAFNQALNAMEKNGEIQALMTKYGVEK